jgi:hypothetical protein
MKTSVIALLAGLSLLALGIGAVVVVSSSDHDEAPTRTSSGLSERTRPEAESPGADDLPEIETAARFFLSSYLKLIYGKTDARSTSLQRVTPDLAASITSSGFRVTPAQQAVTPRVARVTTLKTAPGSAIAVAQIAETPGDDMYPLTFRLERGPDGWLVTRIGIH